MEPGLAVEGPWWLVVWVGVKLLCTLSWFGNDVLLSAKEMIKLSI
jgi:hypothetical protein